MPTSTLNATDSERLQSVLDGIVDESSAQRWAALDQLRYFCDGADTMLLEAIGGKKFSTLAVLLQLLDMATELGGPIAVRTAAGHQRVPVGLVISLIECLLCNATSNLKPFLKNTAGVRNLVTTLSFHEELMYDAEFGPEILDRACNILCYCTFYHPSSATAAFTAADGVAVVTRMLNAATTHYTRTLARPGTALPSRPTPLSGSSAQWDSLTGNICELVANVASANAEAQRAFTQGGALRSLIELVPILTSARAMTVAQGQPSLTFATEQVLLAAATLVWCTGTSQSLLLEAGTVGACLRAIDQCATRLFGATAPPDAAADGGAAAAITGSAAAVTSSSGSVGGTAGGAATTPAAATSASAPSPTAATPAGVPAAVVGSSSLSPPGREKEYDATHDVVVYQACLLLVLNTQLENKPMRESILANALSIANRSGNGRAHAELSALCSLYQPMFEATEHIRLNHYHSDEVVKALQLLTRSVYSKEEAPYLLVHMHGTQTLELMLRCLSNIDEEILFHACLALYALIQRSPPARILFLRKQGIAELAECLRDYNTDVKATSLRILCLLAAESDHAREEMRTEEVLLAILRTVQSYPAEDVNLPVLDAALEAIAHIVLSSRTNQDYIRSVAGLEPLAAALQHCVAHLPEHTPPPSPHPESMCNGVQESRISMSSASARRSRGAPSTRVEPAATCGAPSAVAAAHSSRPPTASFSRPSTATAGRVRAFQGSAASAAADDRRGSADMSNGVDSGRDGTGMMSHRTGGGERTSLDLWKVTETACDALNNVAYRNADNQAALLELGVLPACLTLLNRHHTATSEAVSSLHAGALNLLINMADTNRDSQDALGSADAAAAVHRLLGAKGSPKLVCSACLLLSHVTWNHPPNQHLYGTEHAIRILLCLLSPDGRAAAIGSRMSAGAGGGAGGVPASVIAAAPAAPPAAGSGAVAEPLDASMHATELTLYSMMALVNLTYCNERVQEAVRACGGVPLIQQQLSSPLYEARKTAAFCLGNLVRDNAANARETVHHGGVEALLQCLNDEDDDELSKTAYAPLLTALGHDASPAHCPWPRCFPCSLPLATMLPFLTALPWRATCQVLCHPPPRIRRPTASPIPCRRLHSCPHRPLGLRRPARPQSARIGRAAGRRQGGGAARCGCV